MMGDSGAYKGTIDCFVKTLKSDVSNSASDTSIVLDITQKMLQTLYGFLYRVLWHFTRVSSPTLDALAHGT